jgi:hypothetical protein
MPKLNYITTKDSVWTYLPLIIASTLTLIIAIVVLNRGVQNVQSIPVATPSTPASSVGVSESSTFEYDAKEFTEKNELIRSNNIDDVTKAIRIGHIPDGSVDNRSFSDIKIKAFKLDLSPADRYQKLANFINISELPSPEEATLTNGSWRGFNYTEASSMFTKDGYACIILEPNRFGSTPYISCANALDLPENTYRNVSTFILDLVAEAGMTCTIEDCIITEEQERFPLYRYSRDLVYFDMNIPRGNDRRLIELINAEAGLSANFLKTAGWSVELEDYTETERGWDKEALTSLQISAENDYFYCTHRITVMKIGKRQMVECKYHDEVLEEVQGFYNPYK